jgi:hypothetical protein
VESILDFGQTIARNVCIFSVLDMTKSTSEKDKEKYACRAQKKYLLFTRLLIQDQSVPDSDADFFVSVVQQHIDISSSTRQ